MIFTTLSDSIIGPEAASEFSRLFSSLGTAAAIIAYILLITADWKLFSKAGQAGWKSLIPIYNLYILCKIVDGKGMKFLLLLIPVVDVVYFIVLSFRMARAYGKGIGFGLGLIFLPNIFQLILGFGSSRYVGAQN